MTDIVAECRKHVDERDLPYEVKVTLLDSATTIERMTAALGLWRTAYEAESLVGLSMAYDATAITEEEKSNG